MRVAKQCKLIADYMREHGGISQREAYMLGCTRLAARIHDLKHKHGNLIHGYRIETQPLKVRNMDGSSSTVAYYRFKRAEE